MAILKVAINILLINRSMIMEENIAEHYKLYQKNADPLIKETYFKLLKKSEDKTIGKEELSELSNRLTALKEVIKERNLDINLSAAQNISEQEEKTNTAFNQYIRDGFKSLFIGIGVFGLSLALISSFQGHTFLYFGLIIGGFKFLQGVIELCVGLYVRVSHTNRF